LEALKDIWSRDCECNFYLIVVTFLMYVEKHIPHVAPLSSWHSDSRLKRYSGKLELFWSSGKKHFKKKLNFILKDYVFIFIRRLNSSHSDMWGDKYGEFHFAGNSGICLQKLYMKFVFEPNFYNFECWKSELGLDWLLQHFHHCDWHKSLLCHIY
jgi:hypothetical protein